MFTGLIELIGTVKSIERPQNRLRMTLEAPKNSPADWALNRGDSVSVDGVCLTVVESSGRAFSVDVSQETQERSTLKLLHRGDKVNLERALKMGDRLGGHFVSGHIDSIGRIKSFRLAGTDHILEVELEKQFLKYVVEKGSITIDGISLTVAKLSATSFSVSVIPYTLQHTTLQWKKAGQYVNIEVDLIGKYVERLAKPEQELTLKTLKDAGFTS